MKLKNSVVPLVVLFLTFGCKETTSSKKTTGPENTAKDISELSYLEIYQALFTDGNGGFDAHGDLYGQEATSELVIENGPDPACGEALSLRSKETEREITLAVRANFDLPGNPHTEMLRAYTIKPTETISIGTSKLCYNGKEYAVQREIVSAGFTNGPPVDE